MLRGLFRYVNINVTYATSLAERLPVTSPRKTLHPDVKHQPTKAEMEEPIRLDATLDQLGEAVMRGGAPRREPKPAKEG